MIQRVPMLLAAAAASLAVLTACKIDGSVECSPDTQSCRMDVTRVTPDGTPEPTPVSPTRTSTATATATTTTLPPSGLPDPTTPSGTEPGGTTG